MNWGGAKLVVESVDIVVKSIYYSCKRANFANKFSDIQTYVRILSQKGLSKYTFF